MTRKDFELIALTIANLYPGTLGEHERARVALAMANSLEADGGNPRFDRTRFFEAASPGWALDSNGLPVSLSHY